MKFIDDLYNLYRDHLTGDEEDAIAIVLGVLQDQDEEDLLNLIKQMNEGEVFQMLSMFLVEMMRRKMATEGVGNTTLDTPPNTYH
ncbi:hypothetical protein BEP19_13980 [Ammoniphilus oxalaticus]|uniref:Cytosolic protein n=1 Tax=Ammoniphilus oxalaticus TaxID=66863 RepID=A0A419SEI8_9BACL|nr:DUF6154 family protein [Ammoniphilus oxalaticus]RKD21732.1 hypothetical protein BEP19_13980 [Ammoniphilus oxalaticus]